MPEIVVSKMTSKNQITVPARVRDTLCLEKGDSLLFTVGDDGSVSVRKAVAADEAFARALRPRCPSGHPSRTTRPTVAFDRWDVVVVPFPFTDRPVRRRRPALVVSHPEALGNTVGQSVLAMITSAGHSRWPLDVPLTDLATAGLPAPSVVRMKLFTLDDRLVERRVGTLGAEDAAAVQDSHSRGCSAPD